MVSLKDACDLHLKFECRNSGNELKPVPLNDSGVVVREIGILFKLYQYLVFLWN